MDEKVMVNDILAGLKATLTTYQNAISECQNPDLKHTLQQIRNSDETFQYDLFKAAEQKRYYTPAQQAKQDEIDAVKSQFTTK